MKYLLLVSHATFAQGIAGALEMLLGPRPFVVSCGMEDGVAPDAFRAQLAEAIAPMDPQDEVVVLADIAGGSPIKCALAELDEKGLGSGTIAFGGANLPMAICALMGIEDGLGLDVIRDALLDDGARAIRQV